jgi:hypothetical protein
MNSIIFSMRLNETRKNLTANPERSPLMMEPRSKTYGDHWLTAQFGVKAQLRRHASAYQEVATPDPDCAVSPEGRALKHASAGDRPAFADRDVGVRATQEQLAEFARFPLMFVPFMQYAG